ncbi:kelch-like protein 30 isoform X1 [Perognathus longimembris pacificus]|uniref:kelch-like protein 30 isoform X1 n=1 Tax=Perognathus longimembris pacificus TaxID=214514 RepID=UPI00201985D4|nr:kelch-like protein 30 isoform X1 [Perognathus longimembris pacificus]XP_048200093.1 kelch-like protein 30 isoform X1 [Perognathus longimembris pacificus]
MVQSMDDLDFRLPSHAQDMLDGLRRLRALPKLADVTLLVGGRELRCHRGLLALSSPYFHAMFAGDFAESLSARVELRDVDPDVVEQLVDFAYTGRLRVTRGTAEGLARGASRLHFPAVQKVCGRYLQQQLDAANCLGLCEFGERQGLPGVAAKARAFLRENFEAVARGDEFLRLPPERLAACLAGELLQARPGQSRLAALLRWARHDPRARAAHLPGLLRLLPPDAVPGPCVRRLLATEPLIRGSEACREALARGRSAVPPGLPQELQEVLVVVGGQALEEEDEGGGEPAAPLGNFAFYNTKTRRWMALPDFPDYHKWGFSLAALNNDVYVTGGSAGGRGAAARTPGQPVPPSGAPRHRCSPLRGTPDQPAKTPDLPPCMRSGRRRPSMDRWLTGHQDGHLVDHAGLVLPAEGGSVEARGPHAEGPHQPRQHRAQRRDLRHRGYHPGRGGDGELRPLHRQLDRAQPRPQVCEQLLGGQLPGPALPGGFQCLQVQRPGPAVLQPRDRCVERDHLALPAQVPVLPPLCLPEGGALPHRGQHQEDVRLRPRGQPMAKGAVPAQPARERGPGGAGGRAVRDGRPLAGHGRRLPRGDGGLRHGARRLGAPRRPAPPLALPRGRRHLPGPLHVDAALPILLGALRRGAGPPTFPPPPASPSVPPAATRGRHGDALPGRHRTRSKAPGNRPSPALSSAPRPRWAAGSGPCSRQVPGRRVTGAGCLPASPASHGELGALGAARGFGVQEGARGARPALVCAAQLPAPAMFASGAVRPSQAEGRTRGGGSPAPQPQGGEGSGAVHPLRGPPGLGRREARAPTVTVYTDGASC